jgi:hypothetical protein
LKVFEYKLLRGMFGTKRGKQWETRVNYRMRSFVICTHRIVLGESNQGGLDAWEDEKCTQNFSRKT